MEDIKVSVIVPIYKVERFIARCAESLLNQTLQEIEYIFVNDATPDGSMDILKETIARYPSRADSCHIVEHEVNKGLPSARNSGLAVARGEYVFHCDSDDFVEPTMFEDMYKAAIESSADIVWCDWYLSFEKNERYMKQPNYAEPIEALKGMLSGAMKFNVWNKLVKTELYEKNAIRFPDGYGMGEDMTMMMLFAHADKVCYVPKAYYHYVKMNGNAFSQTYSERHLTELRYNVDRIETFLRGRFGDELNEEIAFLKLDVKFPFLITDDPKKYQMWKEWYPEANEYIMRNKRISLRSSLLQLAAKYNLFVLVSLYYNVVHKLIYGFLYK